MQIRQNELIVAVATPPGQGGVGIVRLSGTDALTVGGAIAGRKLPMRRAVFTNISHDSEVLDQGLVLAFAAPGSFTGEDVVEIHCHGSPVVLQQVLDAACAQGARLARPGEFSERAFLNEKLDLAQAEAVADLIASSSVQAARAAMRSLQGVFSQRVAAIAENLEQLRILLEASIDFPEEEEDFLAAYSVPEKISEVVAMVDALLAESRQGQLFRDGCTVALIGQPNAGKSSLMNALSREETAIVTDIPGTTRDLLKVDLVINGLPVKVVDTAGLRDAQDEVEKKGVERAIEQVKLADVIILVLDLAGVDTVARQRKETLRLAGIELESDARLITVLNKCDLVPKLEPSLPEGLVLSAVEGQGIDLLGAQICTLAGVGAGEVLFTARARHIEALLAVQNQLIKAREAVQEGVTGEIIAEELRQGHIFLGEIVGQVSADELLGKIFSTFCIGK